MGVWGKAGCERSYITAPLNPSISASLTSESSSWPSMALVSQVFTQALVDSSRKGFFFFFGWEGGFKCEVACYHVWWPQPKGSYIKKILQNNDVWSGKNYIYFKMINIPHCSMFRFRSEFRWKAVLSQYMTCVRCVKRNLLWYNVQYFVSGHIRFTIWQKFSNADVYCVCCRERTGKSCPNKE